MNVCKVASRIRLRFSDRYVLGGALWSPPNTFIYHYISTTYSIFEAK